MKINEVIEQYPATLMACKNVVEFLDKIVKAEDSPLRTRFFKCIVRDSESGDAQYAEVDKDGVIIVLEGFRHNRFFREYCGDRYSTGFTRE